MTLQVVTIKASDTVEKARELFLGYPFHHLPVVDQNDYLVGIISAADLARSLHNGHSQIHTVMTPDPTVLDGNDSIALAADIFLVNAFHAIPILEDKMLVGILTTHDLLAYAFKHQH